MLKKIVITSLLGLSLVLTGCGSSDSEGESRLETQQMLDNEDYLGVIAKLEASANSLEDYIALGAAYMGKAGLSLGNIISSLASDSETDNAFAGFVTSISSSSSSTALSDLDTATTYYQKVVNNACLDVNATLSDSQKDICLYIGLANTSSAAVTIDLIAGDVSIFGDDTAGEDYKLSASTCAMQYSFDRNASDCNVSEDGNITFVDSNRTYTSLIVTVDAEIPSSNYYYLMNDTNKTVLTKGYCLLDNFTRYEDMNATAGLYVCPINERPNSEELTTAGVLVDVLNNGIGSMSGASSDETQGDIDEFKCEILGGVYNGSNCNVSLDTNVTEPDMINYLNNQN